MGLVGMISHLVFIGGCFMAGSGMGEQIEEELKRSAWLALGLAVSPLRSLGRDNDSDRLDTNYYIWQYAITVYDTVGRCFNNGEFALNAGKNLEGLRIYLAWAREKFKGDRPIVEARSQTLIDKVEELLVLLPVS